MYTVGSSKVAFVNVKWLTLTFVNRDKNITVEGKKKKINRLFLISRY